MVIRQRTPRPVGPPLRADAFSLAGIPSSAGTARDLAADTLRRWGVEEPMTRRIIQALSEAVGNAVVHACPAAVGTAYRDLAPLLCIGIRVLQFAGFIAAEVWDPDRPPAGNPRTRPHLLAPSELAESGRGMAIIAAMSDQWGVRPERRGKTVWLRFDLPTEPPQPRGSS